jgi:hypothetical protein
VPADYVIITSTPFQFYYRDPGVGGEMDKSFEFTLPSGAKIDSNSILVWTAEWNVPSAQLLTIHININTKEVYWRRIPGGNSFGSLNAVIAPNVLKEADKTNNIEFEVQGTTNSGITFSEVYLMIQRGP